MMILGYDSPITDDGTGVTVTGATALTNLAGLIDGRAGTQDMFEWGAGSEVKILSSFDRLIVPGVAALLNVTGLPVGMTLTATLRRPADGTPTYQPIVGSLVQVPTGDIHAFFIWDPDLDEVEAIEFTLSDDSSPAEMTADDPFTIGEVYIAPAVRATIGTDITDHTESRTATSFSTSGQPLVTPARSFRTFRFSTTPEVFNVVFGDIQDALVKIADNPRVLLFPSDGVARPGKEVLPDVIRRMARYGLAEVQQITRTRGGAFYEVQVTVRESR